MPDTTYFVALPFIDSEEGPAPVEATECQSAAAARVTAFALSRDPKYIGAVAFQRTGDPEAGEFSDAEVIVRFGVTPHDLSGL